MFLLAAVGRVLESHPALPLDDRQDVMMNTEEESAPPLDPVDDLEDLLDDFDAYLYLKTMSDDDWDDLEAIRLVFFSKQKETSCKNYS